jgi:hypothetical protein
VDARLAEWWAAFAALGARPTGSDGERRAVEAARGLLGPEARTDGLVVFPHRDATHAGLAAVAALAALAAPVAPTLAAGVAALAAVGLWAELTGWPWVASWLPRAAAYNVVAQRKVAEPRGTVVVAAALDTPRSRPASRALARVGLWATVGSALVAAASLLATAPPLAVRAGPALVALAVAAAWFRAAQATPSAPDPGGPAAAVAAWHALEPLPLDAVLALTAGGCARQEGLETWLGARLPHLAPPVMVVCFEDVGRGPLRVAASEGALAPRAHRPTGPALVERLTRRGARVAPVDAPHDTLGAAPLRLGERALVLVGGTGALEPAHAEAAARLGADAVALWCADLHG